MNDYIEMRGMVVISVSPLVKLPKLPKLPFVPIIHRLIHSPGRPGARENSRVQTPQTPKLHKQMSMGPGFKRPGSQVKDFRRCSTYF